MKKIGAVAAAFGIAAGLVAGCAPAKQQEITITQRPTPEAAPAEAAGGRKLGGGGAVTFGKAVEVAEAGEVRQVDGSRWEGVRLWRGWI
ncbi:MULTISPECIES: hypothetical protein [Corynebacterium]|uniref:Secreted protein n=1 Tax=Corynebacterium lipophilum TaxID=2804918 RepID=A0AAW5HUY6_9CORY|nr:MULTISPECIES: hypothetical protein [Corynebacterium]MCO6395275.1 hypothetical protein [Corynebacterium lipophilum]MCZ2118083.1 hypothetical protein [Corynebacterium lipophilum]OIR41733.1 hypothetical protein BJP06_09470 [Corynebacterium sp. NML120713]